MKILKIKQHDVLLDDDIWLRVCKYRWQIRTAKNMNDYPYFYIQKTINNIRKTIYLHRLVMMPPFGLELRSDQEVHHGENGPLDNQRSNLTVMLKSEHAKLSLKQYSDCPF